jgi:putative transposase
VFVKINGELYYLWRAVDQEGVVLDAYLSKKRDKKTARKILIKLIKKYGRPKQIITDKLASYKAALRELNLTKH